MTDYHTSQRQLFLRGRRPLHDALVTALYVAGFFLLYGIVGEVDYQDAVAIDAAKASTLTVDRSE